jgi:hypothetical protein
MYQHGCTPREPFSAAAAVQTVNDYHSYVQMFQIADLGLPSAYPLCLCAMLYALALYNGCLDWFDTVHVPHNQQ